MTKQVLAILVSLVAVALVAVVVLILRPKDDDPAPATLQETLLRLGDLPAGYNIGDDSNCGVMTPEGRPPTLDAILGMTFPRTCSIDFRRPLTDAGPHAILSAAIDLPTAELASRVMTVTPELGRAILGSSEDLTAEPYDFEDEAALMEFRDVNTQEEGIVLAWRSSSRINLISVAGEASPDILTFTLKLAETQQKRAGKAESLTPEDNDDRAVVLDRSDLGVAVYWLGLDFVPSGQPAMTLRDAIGPVGPGGSPGNRVKIDYEAPDQQNLARGGIELAVWAAGDWGEFLKTELGDYSTEPPCGEPAIVQLADRRIEIHAPGSTTGQSAPPPLQQPQVGTPTSPPPTAGLPLDMVEDQCPRNHVGVVTFADAVVVINQVNCYACGGPGGPYDSAAAIETVARALTKR